MKRNDFLKKTTLGIVGTAFSGAPILGNSKLQSNKIEVFRNPKKYFKRSDNGDSVSWFIEVKISPRTFESEKDCMQSTMYDCNQTILINIWIQDRLQSRNSETNEVNKVSTNISKAYYVKNASFNGNKNTAELAKVNNSDPEINFYDSVDDRTNSRFTFDVTDYSKYYLYNSDIMDTFRIAYMERDGKQLSLYPSKNSRNYIILRKSFEYEPSGCYLTTSCTKGKGLPDNCEELMILRKFRDEFIIGELDNQKLVENYYAMAPDIVKHIENQSNSQEIMDFIYDELVTKSIQLIQDGKKELAMYYYKNFAEELEKRILN